MSLRKFLMTYLGISSQSILPWDKKIMLKGHVHGKKCDHKCILCGDI
jgi:hypothetical protein